MRTIALIPILLISCAPASVTPEAQLELERAFEESMRGAVLQGNFTVFRTDGEPGEDSDKSEPVRLRQEAYRIEKVVKRSDTLWTFHAQIQFGQTDVTLPVPVQLHWAGDTPIVSVTDLGLPGMGKYTARVAFYRDLYAGMWWGSSHGGNMFGTIEPGEGE